MSEDQDRAASRPAFGGVVRRTMAASEPWWPPRAPAPSGAPDVIVVLADDLGFADLGCFGSEIATPNLDRLAGRGLRWGAFHTAPMCSPTRASLLTGLHPHAAGFGLVANVDPGFPGYSMELADDVLTLGEIFGANGYATAAVGKWHLSKESDNHDGGDRRSWPLQRGFDRFYGFLEGFTSFHHPHRLVNGNEAITADGYPDGYYLTDDLTDRAIEYLQSVDANAPGKPLFMYVAHGAVHAPLHAKPADIDRYRGRYDAGWDAVREARFRRQLELGVIPAGCELPPHNHEPGADVRPWDELSGDEQRLAARTMEVYAAMVDNLDQNVGRLLEASERLGRLDNTIVVFLSDNGASREGEALGTAHYLRTVITAQIGDPSSSLASDLEKLDELGGPTTLPHYPRGWAMVSGTPWRLYKQHTYAGGHTVPFIIAGPGVAPEDRGGIRTQYQHATDLLPTLVDLAGLEVPEQRHGVPARAVHGSSFAAALADPGAPSTHTEQHYAMLGHRGYYRDGWEVVTNHLALTSFDEEWALFDLNSDPTELHDLSAQRPEKVRELVAAWEQAAVEHQVYPLDEGAGVIWLTRPPTDEIYSQPVTLRPGTPTLDRWRAAQLIHTRSATVEIDVERGGDGVLVAHGDQGGGYVAYVEDGRLWFAYNEYGDLSVVDAGAVPSGAFRVDVDLQARPGLRWDVEVRVDGEVAGHLGDVAMLFGMAPFEGIDVGVDRRSPVSWPLFERRGPFPFTGAIRSVRYVPGEIPPDAPAAILEVLREMGVAFE